MTSPRYSRDCGYIVYSRQLWFWDPGSVTLLDMHYTLPAMSSVFGAGRFVFQCMVSQTTGLLDSSMGRRQRHLAAAWWGIEVEING